MTTRRLFLGMLAGLPALTAGAAARRRLVELRHGLNDERYRLVLVFSGRVTVRREFMLRGPDRLVLDIDDAVMARRARKLAGLAGSPVLGTRWHDGRDGSLRVVLDLKGPRRHQVRQWPAATGSGSRLVVDVWRGWNAPPLRPRPAPAAPARAPVMARAARRGRKRMVVVIDPGHGGKDPGAVGKRKTYEKNVVLSISKRLHNLLKADPGITPHLTRGTDKYLRLGARTRIAGRRKGDLFVSVHADAARRRSARGASVYMLSTRGASSAQARWLADRENAADLIGGEDLIDVKDRELQDVMIDMGQGAVTEYSLLAGEGMVQSLKRAGRMHSARVERAGFAVLKAPMASLLVETGFISNPAEEKLLRTAKHQRRVALALRDGIRRYHRDNPEFS